MDKKKSKLKKNIKMFLSSEEGRMLDADVVKTGIALGYNRLIVEGSRTSQGYYVSASQPIKL